MRTSRCEGAADATALALSDGESRSRRKHKPTVNRTSEQPHHLCVASVLDLQDGGVVVQDGQDDLVHVLLQAQVDLLLLLQGVHQLRRYK